MKNSINKIKFILALAIICTTFTACSKDGLNPSGKTKLTGQWAGLTGVAEDDKSAASSLYTGYSNGTAYWIKVDLDGDRKVDYSSLGDDYNKDHISMTMTLSNGDIQEVVFPRALLYQLYLNPSRAFIITFRPDAEYSPAISYMASLM